eukprot:1187701-Prorocentrum_minimum.AAC.2
MYSEGIRKVSAARAALAAAREVQAAAAAEIAKRQLRAEVDEWKRKYRKRTEEWEEVRGTIEGFERETNRAEMLKNRYQIDKHTAQTLAKKERLRRIQAMGRNTLTSVAFKQKMVQIRLSESTIRDYKEDNERMVEKFEKGEAKIKVRAANARGWLHRLLYHCLYPLHPRRRRRRTASRR